ncbi:hypothetical protein [Clostridium sp. C2-6-12]|uniref:hypothetical protein n=1 Tax=Clostridium sp. C2-6-12 TaxID=2698832 RepID=UPI001FABDE60|nr:hypothetical protein [Clostridium sp. C2-6-12]
MSIISLYIGFSKDYIDKYLDSGIIKHRSEIEQKEFDNLYMSKDNFIKYHLELKELCKKNNSNFFEINDDYAGEVNNVYKWIDEQVEKLR